MFMQIRIASQFFILPVDSSAVAVLGQVARGQSVLEHMSSVLQLDQFLDPYYLPVYCAFIFNALSKLNWLNTNFIDSLSTMDICKMVVLDYY